MCIVEVVPVKSASVLQILRDEWPRSAKVRSQHEEWSVHVEDSCLATVGNMSESQDA